MIPNKSILLEQINSVIKRNSWNKNLKSFDYFITDETLKNVPELDSKTFFYYNVENTESLKKLEQRLVALEEQNDHLLYFIHFLFENLADLVEDILSHDGNRECNRNSKISETETYKKASGGTLCLKDIPSVTKRELDVLKLLGKGLCAKEIAHKLFISETTVITHKKHLKEKFDARNNVEIISKTNQLLH
jgi:DNA-binding CsgD family transcriptional regulator